ncbi:MAG: pentapeptide repeat-containing protein [Bacteroidota bacterium]
MKKLLSWARKLNPAIYIFSTILLMGIGFALWRYSVMGVNTLLSPEKFTQYDVDFWNGVFTEFHGFLLDVLIFGLILTIYDLYRDKKERVERWKEEIEDYRGWDEKEAIYRIVGNLKRLMREQETPVDLRRYYLKGAMLYKAQLASLDFAYSTLEKANLKDSNLEKANFWEANLQNVNLQGANLRRSALWYANLQEANLKDAILTEAILHSTRLVGGNLHMANLNGADLRGANLQLANLQGANLQQVDLEEADLKSAIANESQREDLIAAGVTEEMLAKINWVAD